MSGPHTYVRPDTAEYKRIGFRGIPEVEKFVYNLRPACESKVQIILVPGILRRYGRERCKKDRRIYIRNQLGDDQAYDQMSIKKFVDPFAGEPVNKGNR